MGFFFPLDTFLVIFLYNFSVLNHWDYMLKVLFIVFLVSLQMVHAASSKDLIAKVFTKYQSGSYEETIGILNKLQKMIKPNSKKGKEIQGLIYYWKAMSYARLNEFEQAEKFFTNAIKVKYKATDMFYEFGQVLYVSEKLKKARIAFKKSVKQKYKVGVSLYYIGYISQELKEYKKAVNFYNMIEKLPEKEKAEVVQAARMQIGDVYLLQVERQRDAYNAVKDYVIPQYEKALDWDDESKLASEIKTKIENLQRKYEIILFRMRNGRTTARPPYFIRANVLYGTNDNITSLDDETKRTSATEDYSSPYYSAGIFSRYSIYPSSAFSYAPELSANYTKHLSDSDSIKPFNTYSYTAALKTNYEFLYNNAPATIFTDFDYTYNADDADADDSFAFASTNYGVSVSSQLEFSKTNPSTFRFRYQTTDAEDDTGDFTTLSLGYEQIVNFKAVTLFFFNQYAINSYIDPDAETSNNTAFTSRLDNIFPTFYGLFNPTLYVSYTATNYTENEDKGVTGLVTYGVNLNRPISKKWYLTLDASQRSQSGELDSDVFTGQTVTFNLDYIY